jgi:pyruvate ferredoxin oxidoreductase delta subunit
LTSSTEAKPGWKSLPMGAAVTEPGSAVKYKTGDWRAFKPIVDKTKCVNCLLCWIYCPDSAIIRRERWVEINYEHCKGCGICAHECPTKAIEMVEEQK